MSPPASVSPWSAIVLSGGAGVRLGGADKAALEVDGTTLLERALATLGGAEEVMVVGPRAPTSRPVRFAREEPAGGGPAAALLAGIDALAGTSEVVIVLAVDMPRVGVDTVARLLDAARPGRDGAVLVDASGRRQPLCAAYRTRALLAQAPDPAHRDGLAVHRLVAGLELVEVPEIEEESRDVDTWADLRALEARSSPE